MKRTSFVGLLSATVLISTAAPTLSETLNSNPMPDARSIVRVMAQHDDADVQSSGAKSASVLLAQSDFNRDDREPPEEIRPPDIGRGGPMPGLHIAARLAAAETYVGITSGQLDAWRAYAAALIEFVDRPEPDRRRSGPRREQQDGPPPAEGARPQPADAPFFTERLADRAIERGEEAKVLRVVATALRSALAPGQIARLRDVERTFLPPPGSKRPDDRANRHHRGHGDVASPLPPSPAE